MSLLLVDGYVMTMDGARTIHEPGFVLVDAGGRIDSVGPMRDCPVADGVRRVDCAGHLVMPGLIDLFAEVSLPWAATEQPEPESTASDLGLAVEMAVHERVAGGVTTVVLRSPVGDAAGRQIAARAIAAAGLHGVQALPADLAAEGDVIWVDCDLPGRAAGRVDDDAILGATARAGAVGARLATRLWPRALSAAEMVEARSQQGRSAVQHLMELGVLDDRWLVIAPAGLESTDHDLLLESGCSIVSLPVEEAWLGRVGTDLSVLAGRGITVALGTGDPCCGGGADMLEQMKYALMAQNTLRLSPAAITPERALELVTINAARALGVSDRTGALEPGKLADIAVFDMTPPKTAVTEKPLSALVACTRGTEASLVLCAGRIVHQAADPRDRDLVARLRQRRRATPVPADRS